MIAPTHIGGIPVRILALDLSTQTGFATLANGVITHGVADFTRYKGCKSRPAEHEGRTYLNFQRWLRERIALDKPSWIVFEEPMGNFKSAAARNVIVGLRGILLSTAAYYDLPLSGIAQTKLKKWATGKGNAKKPDMLAAARRRWPKEKFVCDNDADAFLLLQCYLESLTS